MVKDTVWLHPSRDLRPTAAISLDGPIPGQIGADARTRFNSVEIKEYLKVVSEGAELRLWASSGIVRRIAEGMPLDGPADFLAAMDGYRDRDPELELEVLDVREANLRHRHSVPAQESPGPPQDQLSEETGYGSDTGFGTKRLSR
ncbi:hypothetical protein [Streptomyces sp. NPDC006334]|uniref:hypothetical protein n=1 Tax=Streptomyces sp. NPDC006334 TaxID=3156754 RepID=UPI0033A66136